MTQDNWNKHLERLREFYSLGLPVETEIGVCHHMLVRDYPKFYPDLAIISKPALFFIQEVKADNEKNGNLTELQLKEFDSYSLIDFVATFDSIQNSYKRVFDHMFQDNDVINKIETEEQFEQIRTIVLDLSYTLEEYINPNPIIQRSIERSKRLKAAEKGKLTFNDVVSAVSVVSGKTYQEIVDMTVFQLYLDFKRIDTYLENISGVILTAGVKEQIKHRDWSDHIDMYEQDKHALTRDQLGQITGKFTSN